MRKVLRQRYDATEGARKAGRREPRSRRRQDRRIRQPPFRAARPKSTRRRSRRTSGCRKRGDGTDRGRRRAEAAVEEAKAQLAGDVEAAKAALARDSELLANQIADSILRGSAA